MTRKPEIVVCVSDIGKFDALPAWRQEVLILAWVAARSDETKRKMSESRKAWWETEADKARKLRAKWKTPASRRKRRMAWGSEEAYREEQRRKVGVKWDDEAQHVAQSERLKRVWLLSSAGEKPPPVPHEVLINNGRKAVKSGQLARAGRGVESVADGILFKSQVEATFYCVAKELGGRPRYEPVALTLPKGNSYTPDFILGRSVLGLLAGVPFELKPARDAYYTESIEKAQLAGVPVVYANELWDT